MFRIIALYGLVFGGAALILHWLGFGFALRSLDPDLYGSAIAIIFTVIGVWAGTRLVGHRAGPEFTPNDQALRSLGVSVREKQVLDLLAAGLANKEIARRLKISPNTVKTHVAGVFAKLEATRRTQAIYKARSLGILP